MVALVRSDKRKYFDELSITESIGGKSNRAEVYAEPVETKSNRAEVKSNRVESDNFYAIRFFFSAEYCFFLVPMLPMFAVFG